MVVWLVVVTVVEPTRGVDLALLALLSALSPHAVLQVGFRSALSPFAKMMIALSETREVVKWLLALGARGEITREGGREGVQLGRPWRREGPGH